MGRVIIKRKEERPLTLEGTLLATYKTSPHKRHKNWSGSSGRWEEVKVYRANAGGLILHRAQLTNWRGENDRLELLSFGYLEKLLQYLNEVSPKAAAAIAKELEASE